MPACAAAVPAAAAAFATASGIVTSRADLALHLRQRPFPFAGDGRAHSGAHMALLRYRVDEAEALGRAGAFGLAGQHHRHGLRRTDQARQPECAAQARMQSKQDFGEAALWYRRSAASGESAGALGLGILHEGGLGVAKDIAEAMRWYRTAAEAGNDVVPALQQWQKRQLRCGQQLVDRAREIGNRLQFENSWIVGQEIPFGLYKPGDSAFQS